MHDHVANGTVLYPKVAACSRGDHSLTIRLSHEMSDVSTVVIVKICFRPLRTSCDLGAPRSGVARLAR